MAGCMLTPDYQIGEAVDGDRNLIKDSWRRSLQDAPAYAAMPSGAYVGWVNEIIRHFVGEASALRLHPTDSLLVARDKVRPAYVYGWLLGRDMQPGLSLVYLFVKGAHRREGIAKALLAEALERASDGPLTHAFRTRFDPWFESLGLAFLPVERLVYGRRAAS